MDAKETKMYTVTASFTVTAESASDAEAAVYRSLGSCEYFDDDGIINWNINESEERA